MAELIIFVLMAAVTLGGALLVVLAANPVHSAMGMLATLFALAVLYVVNLAHLIAAVQIIVYAGAVITLFLFVIMLVGVDREEDLTESLRYQRWAVGGLVGALGLVIAGLALSGRFVWVPAAPVGEVTIPNGTVEAVAEPLFTGWVLAFETVGLLLTISAAGAITLAYFRRQPIAGQTG